MNSVQVFVPETLGRLSAGAVHVILPPLVAWRRSGPGFLAVTGIAYLRAASLTRQ